jgi:hypothetical protein
VVQVIRCLPRKGETLSLNPTTSRKKKKKEGRRGGRREEGRLQEIRDTENVDRLSKKAAGSKQSQTKRMAVWASVIKAIGMRPPKSLDTHIQSVRIYGMPCLVSFLLWSDSSLVFS